MKHEFYPQKSSLKTKIVSSVSKFKSWHKVFMVLLFFFVNLTISAQTITNVVLSTSGVCYGSKASISFTVKNGNGTSNYFTTSTNYGIYLSNTSGTGFSLVASFKSLTAPSGDGGVANIVYNLTTPSTIALGTGYKISISSDVPHIAVNSGTNVSTAFLYIQILRLVIPNCLQVLVMAVLMAQ